MDLQGARGILVNVTAGPDLNIGEFTDVGSIVDDIASDQATVVVGTVIDSDIGDDLKVTVVATGLGDTGRPNVIVDNTAALGTGTAVDYAKLDRPAYARQQAAQHQGMAVNHAATQPMTGQYTARQSPPQHMPQEGTRVDAPLEQQDMEYLDIPAFLRRQAD